MSRRNFIGVALLGLALWLNWGGDGSIIDVKPSSPLPGTGYHMLVVEDRPNRQKLEPAQFDAIFSTDIDAMVREVQGKKYLYDQNQDMSKKDDPWVIEAMKLPRESLPWLIHDYNGKGESIPYPAKLDDAKAKVKAILGK